MLTRIYIHNFRSFVNFELRLGRIGLLIGYNGTGKTSVVDVLSALYGLLDDHLDVTAAFPTDTLTSLSDETQQRFELDLDSPHGAIRYVLLIEHHPDEETCRISHEEVRVGGERLYWYSDGTANIAGIAPLDGQTIPFGADRSLLAVLELSEDNALSWFQHFIHNIATLKLNPQMTNAASRKDERKLATNGANFASWCRHLVLEQREVLHDAEETLRDVLPGFRSINLQAAGRTRVMVARFESPGRKFHDVDFDKLSDGQRNLIILYVALHYVKHDPGLLCLDEPDNFVAIREIQPFLVELTRVFDDVDRQVLIISHSSEVIDFFAPSEAILLERPDGGVTRIGELRTDSGLKLSELLARGWHGAR